MTCTGGEDGKVKWIKDDKDIAGETNLKCEVKAEQGILQGSYFCEHGDVKDMFYLKVKGKETSLLFITMTLFVTQNVHHNNTNTHSFCVSVCKNCYELSGLMAWIVILGDVLITGGVILIIYSCATRNRDGTQKKGTENI